MTYSIEKKDLVYGSIVAVLVIAMIATFAAYKVQQNNSFKSVKSYQAELGESNDSPENNIISELPEGSAANGENIKHMTCDGQTTFGNLPSSNTYISDGDFSLAHLSGGVNYHDINGDGLVDFTYNSQSLSGGSPELESLTRSCVYLNNGHGWDRAYICYARTVVDLNTGAVLEGDYRGDCAGTPSSN